MTDTTISNLPLSPNTGGLAVPGADYILIEDVATGTTYKAFLPNPYNLYSPLLVNNGYNATLDRVNVTLNPLPSPSPMTANSTYYVIVKGTNTTVPITDSLGTTSVGAVLLEGDILIDNGSSYNLIRNFTSANSFNYFNLKPLELLVDGNLNLSIHNGVVLPPTSSASNLLVPLISTAPLFYNNYRFFVKNNSLQELTLTFANELEYFGSGNFTVTCPVDCYLSFEMVEGSSGDYWVETTNNAIAISSLVKGTQVSNGGSITLNQTVTLAGSNSSAFTLPELSTTKYNQIFIVKSGIFVSCTLDTFTGDSLDNNMNQGTHNSVNLSQGQTIMVMADHTLNTWIKLN